MYSRQGKIDISNLPNTTPRQHILQYLQTAGPIKSINFHEQGQRLSATIYYYDYQSAQTAKKFLDQKQFNTRKIKITLQQNKELKSQGNYMFKSKLQSMSSQDKKKLFKYLKMLRDDQGQMFVDFLDSNQWLAQELLKF